MQGLLAVAQHVSASGMAGAKHVQGKHVACMCRVITRNWLPQLLTATCWCLAVRVCGLQLGADTVRLQVLLDLLVALAAKPAFHALRTQQRLGYLVRLKGHVLPGRLLQQPAGAENKNGSSDNGDGEQRPADHSCSGCAAGEQEEGAGRVLGLLVAVQSPHTGCQTVQERVQAWLEGYQEQVQQLTSEEFARQLQVRPAGCACRTMEPPC
jgi:hypothetical protein